MRLLTGGTLSQHELTTRVRRDCLSFRPSQRDRADLISLGADSTLLREIDACARRATPPTPPTLPMRPAPSGRAGRRAVAGSRAPPRAPRPATGAPPAAAAPVPPAQSARPATLPVSAHVAPPIGRPAPLSAVRTAFVQGVGQRGIVGTRPALPLVFEVRDTTGAPVVGERVTFRAANARLDSSHAATDSSGRVQADLVLGSKAGPAVVGAAVGAIERQATLFADPGPAARLLLRCGDGRIERQVAFTTDVAAALRVTGEDAFGNAVPVVQLEAASGDKSVLRIGFVGTDSLGGTVRVRPGQPGSTSLVIVASGQREDLTALVLQERNSGAVCP